MEAAGEVTERKEQVELIRRVARDLFYELLEEHLSEYIHVEKPFHKAELEAKEK